MFRLHLSHKGETVIDFEIAIEKSELTAEGRKLVLELTEDEAREVNETFDKLVREGLKPRVETASDGSLVVIGWAVR